METFVAMPGRRNEHTSRWDGARMFRSQTSMRNDGGPYEGGVSSLKLRPSAPAGATRIEADFVHSATTFLAFLPDGQKSRPTPV